MDTRFAHLNPDRRALGMSRESGDESGASNPEEGSAQESQREDRFGNLTPERRLQELRFEMERLSQMMSGSSRGSEPAVGRRDPCSELRRYSKVLTGVLPKFPTEAEAPVWFESVESALEAYEVPGEFWGRLVFPLVAERVPFLSTRLSPTEHKDYQVIKQTVLDELKLSAGEYLKRFSGSGKRANEGWRPFATRLESYLHFYLDARGVSTFEGLVKLLVADQLKKNLSEEAARYVTLQEGRKWMSAPEMAALLRTFEEAQGANSAARQTKLKAAESQSASSARPDNERTKGRSAGKSLGTEGKPKPRACYSCGSTGHQKWNCPRRPKQPTEGVPGGKGDSLAARVSMEGPVATHSELIPVSLGCRDKHIEAVLDTGAEITVVRESVIPPDMVQPHGTVNLTSAFGEKVQAKLAVIPLTMSRECGVFSDVREPVPVLCALTDRLTARTDCLLSEEAWKLLSEEGAFEGVVVGNSEVGGAQLELEHEPLNAVVVQQQDEVNTRAQSVERHATEETLISEVAVTGLDEGDQQGSTASPDGALTDSMKEKSASEEFREKQRGDPTLQEAWGRAATGKGGMLVIDGLLYHRDKMLGQTVTQLVLPECRRAEVLQLAHESCWAGHLGCRKTSCRIKYSFYWPGVENDVRQHCNSCHGCQTRSDLRRADGIPIEPLTRPRYPFQQVNVDVIGPLEPVSGRGHKYCLCVIDLCTRWPEVVCLRSLSARATCDALLAIFSRTGIPEVIASDCGTNFTAALTREFLAKLGCSPRFSTPGHPESNGAVERWNKTFKNMLYHVIEREGRNWDQFVPFLLWGYREVPHDTTGVAPFEMLYGRQPTGPLGILRKAWTGETAVPGELGASPAAYMEELRGRLRRAAEVAELIGAKSQNAYAAQFNKRAKAKKFEVGELVLVFDDQRPGKMFPKWEGPGSIAERHREHSYFVQMPAGNRKLVHASKLRPYHSRVMSVGVMFEEDGAFGEVECAPRPAATHVAEVFPSQDMVTHLGERERKLICGVFKRHGGRFGGRPTVASVRPHEIVLQDGFVRRSPHPYRVPKSLQPEVGRQVDELLDLGLIFPCESPYAHPLVCVPKKDGSVRLCVDFRALNAGTVADAYPMALQQELIMSVGKAKYITLLDLRRGYWQVPLEPSSRLLTAFACHRGQFAWTVMPFGLKNAAQTFQRAMNELLRPHSEYCCAYLDDIAVFSETLEEHVEHLGRVFETLERVNLSVKMDKCQVARPSIRYLGHVVGSGRHAPDPEKLAAIEGLKAPKTKTELRSVLGLCGYYRSYVKDYAEVARPLTELTGRRIPNRIPWSAEADGAFRRLKTALCEAAALSTPDPGKPYWLFTDASAVAAGACLSQRAEDGTETPIAFASHKFSPTQTRWSTIEREAFAVIWGLGKFDFWLFGAQITVVSDHNPLAFLTQSTLPGAKLTRWALALQRYHVVVQHRKGVEHGNADALSRVPNECWEVGSGASGVETPED